MLDSLVIHDANLLIRHLFVLCLSVFASFLRFRALSRFLSSSIHISCFIPSRYSHSHLHVAIHHTHMLPNLLRVNLLLIEFSPVLSSIICHQCNGWSGSRASTEENSCQNYNNQCLTEFFCVRKEDPIIPSAGYKTYKSDCWMQPSVQVSPTDAVQIVSGRCYNVTDASVPPKQWKYCFCSNKDYCNSDRQSIISFFSAIGLLAMFTAS